MLSGENLPLSLRINTELEAECAEDAEEANGAADVSDLDDADNLDDVDDSADGEATEEWITAVAMAATLELEDSSEWLDWTE